MFSSCYLYTIKAPSFGHAAQGSSGYPLQDQLPGPPVQYQFSNGVLVPSYAVPMQPGPALPSSPSSMRPPMSHMFNPFSQQARQAALSGPPPPPSYAASPLAQAAPSRLMDRSGAGYTASSRKGHQGNDASNQECHFKPGNCCGPDKSSCCCARPVHRPAVYLKVLL